MYKKPAIMYLIVDYRKYTISKQKHIMRQEPMIYMYKMI